MVSSFEGSLNKAKVRKIDLHYLETFSKEIGRKLNYFGLPGKSCLDIKQWRKVLNSVTAFEFPGSDYEMMVDNLTRLGLYKSSFPEDIDKFVLNVDNNKYIETYDVINLDYEGHLITGDKRSNRLDAINDLIKIQKRKNNECFLLLLTNKGLRTKAERIFKFLNEAKALVDSTGCNAAVIFEWARIKGKQWDQLFISTPIIIMSYGLLNGYEIDCNDICFYKGKSEKSPMIHLVFKFKSAECSTPLIGPDRFKPIPLKKIKEILEGKVEIYTSEMPEFKEDLKCSKCGTLIRYNAKFCDECGIKL